MDKQFGFKSLSEAQLTEINGGKSNWGGVVGHCIGGGIIGSFGGAAGAFSGCVIGAGSAIIDGL